MEPQSQSEGSVYITIDWFDCTAMLKLALCVERTMRDNIAVRVSEMQKKYPRFKPHLAIVQQGGRPDSSLYVRMKAKAAAEANIEFTHLILPEDASEEQVMAAVEQLNGDEKISGVLVQLPLSDSVGKEGERRITEAVSPKKDVDGFHAYNIGLLSSRASQPLFPPCTPAGAIVLLESTGIKIAGKHAVVLGRSDIVGSPVCAMLRRKDATVTQCHSRTQNLPEIVKQADIVIAAIGQPEFLKGDWIKPGAVVIDVGTNYIPDASKKSGQKLVGDVEYESAAKVASYITPVPGGVGPMTVAMLMQNTLVSAERWLETTLTRKIKPLKLDLLEKVPSDIEIASAQAPKQVSVLAEEIGVSNGELDMYGKFKAKVDLSLLKRLEHRK